MNTCVDPSLSRAVHANVLFERPCGMQTCVIVPSRMVGFPIGPLSSSAATSVRIDRTTASMPELRFLACLAEVSCDLGCESAAICP